MESRRYFEGTTVEILSDYVLKDQQTFFRLRQCEESPHMEHENERMQPDNQNRNLIVLRKRKITNEICNCHNYCVNAKLACWPNCHEGEKCDNTGDFKEPVLGNFDIFYTGTGMGVKTNVPIKKGEFVGHYFGELTVSKPPASRLRVVEYGNGIYVDAGDKGGISRFFNSSCLSGVNLELMKRSKGQWPQLLFFATRDISIGEELLWNYSSSHKFTKCLCKVCEDKRNKQVEVENVEVMKENERAEKSVPTTNYAHTIRECHVILFPLKLPIALSFSKEMHSTPSTAAPKMPPLEMPPTTLKNPTAASIMPPREMPPTTLKNSTAAPIVPISEMPPTTPQLSTAALPVKQYKCSVENCRKSYNRKNDLNRHINMKHSNVQQTHGCNLCSVICNSYSNLKKHMDKKHDVEYSRKLEAGGEHSCIFCKKNIKNPKDVYRHIRHLHPEVEEKDIICCCGKRPNVKY